ncbi:MAG: hypothetical protein IKH50_01335 [Oscillospiraceae bacterium]|nr:hypothetical protein [Oscillospiraceae bacterium]
MEINDTTKISSFYPKSEVKSVRKSAKTSDTSAAQESGISATQKQDTFVRQETVSATDTGIYSKESITKTIEELEDQRTQAFVSMIEKMFQSQGNSEFLSVGDITKNISLHFSTEDIEAAKESISDGGFYSVDAVATRIMDMAMSLAGDDPEKISVMRDAVTKGFGKAAETLHLKEDDMPDITKDTLAEVMKRFDDWEESYKKTEDEKTEETV